MVHEETDVDEFIARKRKSESSFGIRFDSRTRQHVSFPDIPNSIDNLASCPDLEHDEIGIEKTTYPEVFNAPLKKRKFNKCHSQEYDSQKADNCVHKWIARGKTFRHKNKLKMAGFQWDKKRKFWYTLREPHLYFKDVIIFRVDEPQPLSESIQNTNNTQTSVNCESFRWIAKGNTYPVKEELKKAGMQWDASRKEWYSDTKPDCVLPGVYFKKTLC